MADPVLGGGGGASLVVGKGGTFVEVILNVFFLFLQFWGVNRVVYMVGHGPGPGFLDTFFVTLPF